MTITAGRVTSADGTTIAYEKTGTGPALVLVDGATCYRDNNGMRELAALLADRFTVLIYDRRGRGESTDTAPYAVDREVEDLAAVVATVGGPVSLYGISSGAALALRATAAGLPVERLALYELSAAASADAQAAQAQIRGEIEDAVAAGRPAHAVRLFLRHVGLPRPIVALMRFLPFWSKMKGVAHTLPYDLSLIGALDDDVLPSSPRWASVAVPTHITVGSKSPDAALQAPGRALAEVIPGATFEVLPGQMHQVSPKAIAPVLARFFAATTRA